MDWTLGVSATGEKTAREPEVSLTAELLVYISSTEGTPERLPTVALPPNLINPNRRNGTESVVIPGTTSRITITSSGLLGTSFADIVIDSIDVVQNVG